MILQALKDYYDRKAADPEGNIAPLGLEWKPLEFLVVVKEDGEFVAIEDLRERKGNRLIGKRFLLPRSTSRSGSKSYATTFLLWDHIGYLLGQPADDPKSPRQLQTWIDSLKALPTRLVNDPAVGAVINFYAKNQLGKALLDPSLEVCLKSVPCNMSFRLDSDLMPVAGNPVVIEYAKSQIKSVDDEEDQSSIGYCLISGELDVIKRTHAKTPINKDNNSLIGFQVNSGYDSYGKEKAFNAPVGRVAEFAYTTALNTLLKSADQRFSIADAVYICWSAKKIQFESEFSYLFDDSKDKDDPDQFTKHVKALYHSVESGAFLRDEFNQNFFILGLSPGGGTRISVRDWQVGTIAEFAVRIHQHFEDLSIVKPPNEREFYSLWWLLKNIAIQDKSENIPPNVAGDFIRSILDGTPYPQTLLQSALRRIHSDSEYRVKPARAALIKAYLNRYLRAHPNKGEKEIEMALDKNHPAIAYHLGRLFAVLEKTQEDVNGKATIQQSYYSSASGSPVVAFSTLTRLNKHHLAKLEKENYGLAIVRKQTIGEIMGHIDDFPSRLDLHAQGLFAIGYYHQMQDFFTKKDKNV
jgi:CRISPR-associated protein Csd1